MRIFMQEPPLETVIADQLAQLVLHVVYEEPVKCPYWHKCREYETGSCATCKHNKRTYYESDGR